MWYVIKGESETLPLSILQSRVEAKKKNKIKIPTYHRLKRELNQIIVM